MKLFLKTCHPENAKQVELQRKQQIVVSSKQHNFCSLTSLLCCNLHFYLLMIRSQCTSSVTLPRNIIFCIYYSCSGIDLSLIEGNKSQWDAFLGLTLKYFLLLNYFSHFSIILSLVDCIMSKRHCTVQKMYSIYWNNKYHRDDILRIISLMINAEISAFIYKIVFREVRR